MNLIKKLRLHWCTEGLRTVAIMKNWPTIILSNFRFGKETVMVKLRNGLSFMVRKNRTDSFVLREIFFHKIYHRNLNCLPRQSVVIDIGANIGAFSILAASLGEDVTVYSYEPFSENFHLLENNIALNEFSSRIVPFCFAVGDQIGEKVVLSKGSSGVSTIYEKSGLEVIINVITLEEVFFANNIDHCDLLKLDCEGAEYDILYSTPREIFDKIKFINMEFHEQFDTGRGMEMKEFLEKRGFRVTIEGNTVGYIFAENCNKFLRF